MVYWAYGDPQQLMKEIDRQRDILSTYGNIPKDRIQVRNGSYIYKLTGNRTNYHLHLMN